MITHFLNITFPNGRIEFNNENITIFVKGAIFMSKKHHALTWDAIDDMLIEELQDSSIKLTIKISGKKDVILSTEQEFNIKKRNNVKAQVELLKVYFSSKK